MVVGWRFEVEDGRKSGWLGGMAGYARSYVTEHFRIKLRSSKKQWREGRKMTDLNNTLKKKKSRRRGWHDAAIIKKSSWQLFEGGFRLPLENSNVYWKTKMLRTIRKKGAKYRCLAPLQDGGLGRGIRLLLLQEPVLEAATFRLNRNKHPKPVKDIPFHKGNAHVECTR